jgi:uncharacterized membrane protein YeaQ/YmgE (transglycosylase-associated protein family)
MPSLPLGGVLSWAAVGLLIGAITYAINPGRSMGMLVDCLLGVMGGITAGFLVAAFLPAEASLRHATTGGYAAAAAGAVLLVGGIKLTIHPPDRFE